ncbi:Cof-type HAD-IIB family hydrolase [Lactobacillus sp. S2-2]|uniref:Cof-type HAD-IIB family hydrolase n=1 Tax=Lactobacillus sp. S2-2 TaxID=2692917 RepID=UPI001F31F7F4|nr:Cof-type HAD-IIB family hydrolase [Lactobacillus sp. S2-2]MCF6515268.1 Cof-type HAD-IIB family hydrolase [Lactobacillus sp. S2-2]
MIKMIALDLDGSLLTDEKTITEENKKELKKLHNQGIKIVICTGRPINAIKNYLIDLDLFEFNDFTVCFNGGLVLNNVTENIMFKKSLENQQIEMLHKFVSENHHPLDILDFDKVYQINDLKSSIYQSVIKAPIEFESIKYKNLPDEDFAKGIIATQPEEIDQILNEVSPEMEDNFYIVRSQPTILEFLPKGVNKKGGLQALLNHFDLDFSNLMAFGDAKNDYEMLQAAEVGVAMENAKPDIQEVANDVTLNNNNSGVADYLEKYFQ